MLGRPSFRTRVSRKQTDLIPIKTKTAGTFQRSLNRDPFFLNIWDKCHGRGEFHKTGCEWSLLLNTLGHIVEPNYKKTVEWNFWRDAVRRLAPRTTIVLFRHIIIPGQPTHLERAKVILHEKKNPYKCSLTIQDAKLNSIFFHWQFLKNLNSAEPFLSWYPVSGLINMIIFCEILVSEFLLSQN